MSSRRRTGEWLLDLSLMGVVLALIGLAPRGGGDVDEASPLRQDPGLALEAATFGRLVASEEGRTGIDRFLARRSLPLPLRR